MSLANGDIYDTGEYDSCVVWAGLTNKMIKMHSSKVDTIKYRQE